MRETLEKHDPSGASSPDGGTDPQWQELASRLQNAYVSIGSPSVRRRLFAELMGDIISAERWHASGSPLESELPENEFPDREVAESRSPDQDSPGSAPGPAAPSTAAHPWDDPKVAAQLLLSNPLFQEDDPFLAYSRFRREVMEAAARAFKAKWDPAEHPRGGANAGWFRTTSGGGPQNQPRQQQSADRMSGVRKSYSRLPATDVAPVASGWTKNEVVALLTQSEAGKNALATLSKENVEVRSCEKVEAQVRFRVGGEWGPYEKKQWGAMTTTAAGGKKTIHMPKNGSPEETAFLLVHEAAHAAGGGEREAYEAETRFAIESPNPNVQRLARRGLVTIEGGRKVVDKAGLEAFIRENYGGWYTPDPNVQYKTNDGGKIIIEYGAEIVITDWRK